MRLSEIINESGALRSTFVIEGQTDNAMREVIRSVLIPLKSQKVSKITVDQFMDTLRENPMLQGIDFDQDYIVDQVGQSKVVNKIQADPENNGLMTIYFEFPQGDRQVDQKTAEREKEGIKKAAIRAIKDKQK
ncbi:hypothetical protein D3C87_482750 [compost metagenome]